MWTPNYQRSVTQLSPTRLPNQMWSPNYHQLSCPTKWTMSLFIIWMEYSLPHEVAKWFIIVNPLWVQRHKQMKKVQDILRRAADRDFIFIPIVVSGHWVLWTKMRHKVSTLTREIVFCDPLNNKATGILRCLANILIQTISSATEDHTIVLEG